MIDAVFAIPGDIDLPTGGYVYARRVLALLPGFGVAVRHLRLPASFPVPSGADLAETGRLLAAVQAPAVMIDGLAYGAMPLDVIASVRTPIIALVHHPLCLEAGLSAARQSELFALERTALGQARRAIVTSARTGQTLAADFAVPQEKIAVAEPGTDPAPRAHGSAGGSLALLSVGSIIPRKAYDLLLRALAPLRDRDWRLTIAGATDRSPEALASLNVALDETRLRERVVLTGPVDQERLGKLYAAADAFLMPSLYEGYGMVLAEAMARGLPIVCTTGGAAAETVPDAAAIKVPPGDMPALTTALARLIDDAALRRRLADASWAAGQSLPHWEETARRIAAVIAGLAP
jgi:glycosyltransferase involved in cell wall biosynthesis